MLGAKDASREGEISPGNRHARHVSVPLPVHQINSRKTKLERTVILRPLMRVINRAAGNLVRLNPLGSASFSPSLLVIVYMIGWLYNRM